MKIVLTWWTHTWKTSILRYLESKWYNCLDEVAGDNMNMLLKILWKDWYSNWRKNNFLEFQQINIFSNLKRDFDLKKTDNFTFLDRWVFDWIASLKREKLSISESILNLVDRISYDYIFIIDPIDFHEIRGSTWRMLDKDVSEKWNNFIIDEYVSRFWREKVVHVPFDTIENRAKFILNILWKN